MTLDEIYAGCCEALGELHRRVHGLGAGPDKAALTSVVGRLQDLILALGQHHPAPGGHAMRLTPWERDRLAQPARYGAWSDDDRELWSYVVLKHFGDLDLAAAIVARTPLPPQAEEETP